jgi:hypothetical protein
MVSLISADNISRLSLRALRLCERQGIKGFSFSRPVAAVVRVAEGAEESFFAGMGERFRVYVFIMHCHGSVDDRIVRYSLAVHTMMPDSL